MSYQVLGARRFGPRRPRARYRANARLDGLGLSLKPPKWARKAARSVGRVVRSGAAIAASSFIPGAGLLIGSRKAPRWLRAPKGVRPFVRKAAKVQLAAGAVIAAGVLAPAFLPAAASKVASLLPLAMQLIPKGGTSAPGPGGGDGGGSPGYSADYGGGDGGGGGGGAVDADSTPTVDPEPPAAASGGAALAIGALILGGILLASRTSRSRKVA